MHKESLRVFATVRNPDGSDRKLVTDPPVPVDVPDNWNEALGLCKGDEGLALQHFRRGYLTWLRTVVHNELLASAAPDALPKGARAEGVALGKSIRRGRAQRVA
jgi:hypothetical protein